MSLNTAHASNGVLIHAGEYILLHSDSVSMEFSGQDDSVFKGSKQGRIYLTSHRMIFNNKKPGDLLQSFSAPFITLSDVELEQPVFGANYIKGKVRAQPNGNFVGEVKFKLYFKSGGAIEYGQALLRAASTAQRNFHRGGLMNDDPPPYTPSGAWHEAPPPAYQPPQGYYGWLPTHDAFSGPQPNTVFMSDNPPPYPGIGGPPPYMPPQSHPPQNPTGPGCSWPQQPGQGPPGMWNGFSVPPGGQPGGAPPSYAAAGFYPGQPDGNLYPGQPAGNPYPGQPAGNPYPGQPAGNPYPGQPAGNPYPGQPGANPYAGQPATNPYAGQASSGPFPGQPGPQPTSGASGPEYMGFSLPPSNPKEVEAMASAYNQTPYYPPGNGQNMPPPYDYYRKNQ